MKILVSGTSGLVGSTLVASLKAGQHEVYSLVRTRADLHPHEIAWDAHRGVISPALLEGLDTVVHLAGESIAGRWTAEKKKHIRDSRVQGTRLLCRALSQLQQPPSVLVCASAIGYYGNRGDEILTEQSSKGEGFLADVVEEWEEATRLAAEKGIRVVNLRFGVILSPKGGALKQMLPPFQWGVGGKMGLGTQYMSWVALEDVISIIHDVMQQQRVAGPVNVVSPHSVTNAEFTQILGHVLHRPTFLNMPAFAVKLVFGEMGEALLLSSTRVQPKKLEQIGFQFAYPDLEEALQHMLGRVSAD